MTSVPNNDLVDRRWSIDDDIKTSQNFPHLYDISFLKKLIMNKL